MQGDLPHLLPGPRPRVAGTEADLVPGTWPGGTGASPSPPRARQPVSEILDDL